MLPANVQAAGNTIAGPTLELMLAVAVFSAVALLAVNYPKVGKPLEFFIIAALSVRAIGAFQNA